MGATSTSALVTAMNDRNNDAAVRRKAAEALGEIGPGAKAAVKPLTEAIKDKEVALSAVKALGSIGPDAKSAIPALSEMITKGKAKKDRTLKKEVQDAIKKIQQK